MLCCTILILSRFICVIECGGEGEHLQHNSSLYAIFMVLFSPRSTHTAPKRK
jgi:hypothetical protein